MPLCLLTGLLSPALVCGEPEPSRGSVEVKQQHLSDASAMVDGIAAHVNDDTITISEVMAQVRVMMQNPRWTAGRSRNEAFREAYAESLGQAINQRMVIQEYEAGNARLPEWLVDKRIAEIVDTRFDGDRGKLMRELADQVMTLEDWRQSIREQMVVSAMRQSNVEAHIQISPAQVRQYYHDNVTNYIVKAATHLRLIFLKPLPDESPEDLQARAALVEKNLSDGGRFADIAKALSNDASARDGGDWGWIAPEDMLRDELVAALAEMPVGSHRAVVTPVGAYILLKEGQRRSGQLGLEEVRSEIERQLSEAESRRLFLAWMLRLRAKSHIKTFNIFE